MKEMIALSILCKFKNKLYEKFKYCQHLRDFDFLSFLNRMYAFCL